MIAESAHKFVIISLITLIGVWYLLTFREGHSWGGDFSQYIHHAKNIAEGIDYGETGYIYNPGYAVLGPETYPPMFPLLLVPAYTWFGMNLTVMKGELVLFFLLALWSVLLCFKADLPPFSCTALIAIIGFNPYFWDFKDHILSDIPFFLLTYLSLWYIDGIQRASSSQSRGDRSSHASNFMLSGAITGCLVYLAYGTRSLGLVLLPCLVLYDCIQFRTIRRVTLLTGAICVLLMILQGVLFHNASGYFDHFTLISFERIIRTALIYIRQFSMFWSNGYSHPFRHILSGITLALAITGLLTRVRKGITIFEIFGFVYGAAILIFPVTQRRYLLPLFPLYGVYMLTGIQSIASFHQIDRKKYAAVLLVMIASAYIGKYTRIDYGPFSEGIHTSGAVTLFQYVQHNTHNDDVFIFQKPRVLALFTGRQTSGYSPTSSDRELWEYFQEIHAAYVITGLFDSESFLRFIDQHQRNFQPVFSNTDFCIYKIL